MVCHLQVICKDIIINRRHHFGKFSITKNERIRQSFNVSESFDYEAILPENSGTLSRYFLTPEISPFLPSSLWSHLFSSLLLDLI